MCHNNRYYNNSISYFQEQYKLLIVSYEQGNGFTEFLM